MRPFKWGWREKFSLWRYNWIKRPWRNFLWAYGPDGAEFRRTHPNYPRGYPKAGRMTRSDMEWAHNSFAQLEHDPEFRAVGEQILAKARLTKEPSQ